MSEGLLIAIISAVLGSSVLTTILNRIFTKRDKKEADESAERIALRLLMKSRVRDLCLKYIEQGWIYADEYEDLISMWENYHYALGGNGYLDHLMEAVKELEIRGVRKEHKKK